MIDTQEDVDFILKDVMRGKSLEKVEKQFMLEEFIEGEPLIIGGNMLFEIVKNDGEVIILKPIGCNIMCKDKIDHDKQTYLRRYIKDGEIVETTL
jgi:hypothetical protein